MNLEIIIKFLSEITSFILVLSVIDVLETVSPKNNYKIRYLISLIVFTVLSVIDIPLKLNAPEYGIHLVISVLKFVFGFLIIYGKLNISIIYITFIVDFPITFTASCITNTFFAYSPYKNCFETASVFIMETAISVLLRIAKRKKEAGNMKTVLSAIPKHIYVLVMGIFCCLSGAVTISNEFIFECSNIQTYVFNAILLLLGLIIAIVLLSLVFNVMSKQEFNNTSKILEKQVEAQLMLYEQFEKSNIEIRRFRHDYINHMSSVLSLIKSGEYSEAELYIEKLQNAGVKRGVLFETGNKVADAILSYKSGVLNENVKIEYQGVIPPSLKSTDLCVILSNSLDNAMEACLLCEHPCVISVAAATIHGYFVLTVKNPTTNPDTFYTIPATTKKDSKNHGIGLLNIKDTAGRNGGTLNVKCENFVFELSVTMKLE